MNSEVFSSSRLAGFISRLHTLVGIFVGPFIIIAAITGSLYGVSLILEDWIYQETLFVKKTGVAQSLALQVAVAEKQKDQGDVLYSVRPASTETETTKVLYTNKSLGSSEYHTFFINPYTLEVADRLVTYGSSGSMPTRMLLDLLHKDLLLGKWGQWYSELAATWLWISALTGFVIFLQRIKTKKISSTNKYQKLINTHANLGLFCLIGMIMLSITGLTWSNWAGDQISKIRNTFEWHTPQLERKLSSGTIANTDLNLIDKIQSTAFENGIDTTKIEMKPPTETNQTWMVGEIGKGFPSQVDAVAINPDNLQVTGKSTFNDFPLMAKLTRWGIDLHMGTLFGFWNQVLVIAFSVGISFLVVTGYMIWFKTKSKLKSYSPTHLEFVNQPILNKVVITISFLTICLIFPLTLSLLVIVAVDSFRYKS